MADDDQATATPAPSPAGMDQATIDQYLALLRQGPPNIQPDQTPVDDSGFWGGFRHVTGILGEALGGGKGTPGYAALSPSEREAAGIKALGDFGTSLMAASRYQPGQTIFSNLAQGFQGAERSYRGTEQDAAGMLAARQAYAADQQANQLARIKEAIPLLTLQGQIQRAQAAAKLAGGGAQTPGGGGSIATGGSISVPPDYLPFYQEASARTGIPAEVLMAQHAQESGFNPGATGAAGEIGIGQISPKTATDPGYGMTGLKNPDVLRDPRTNINFAADYLAARAKAAGADFSTPEGIAKALKAYNGGGDPNYVQNVTRYLPAMKTALAPPAAPGAAPGRTAAATPPPPNAGPLPVPPIPPANPPPVVPPVAPPVQTAGPGAGNAPVMPPDYTPPQPGAVVRPAEGGANPTTPPAQTPQFPDIVAGGATFRHPGTSADFQAKEYAPPPATEDLNPNLSPQTLAGFNVRRQALQLAQQQAQFLNPPDIPKALIDIKAKQADLEAEAQNAAQAKAQSAAEKLSTYNAAQRKEIQTRYDNQISAYNAAATAQQASANKIAEASAQSGFDINKAGQQVAYNTDQDTLKDLATRAGASQAISPQLQQLGVVMKGALPPGFVASLVNAHPGITPFLTAAGAITPEQANDTQLMLGMTNYLSTQLRPTGSGRLNLPEIDAFKSVLPTLLQQPGGRVRALAFLQNLNDRVPEERQFANQYFRRVNPATGQPAYNLDGLPAALAAPRQIDPRTGVNTGGLGPVVPPMPPLSTFVPPMSGDPSLDAPDARAATARAASRDWIAKNVEVGRPYMGWDYPTNPKTNQPDKTKPPELQIKVREN